MTRPSHPQPSRPTAIDLFSGAGGLSVGLKRGGFRVLGAVEIDELAVNTYWLNHRTTRIWEQDIRGLSPQTVMSELGLKRGELDLLAGCPPCQGFSTMRTLRRTTSVDDDRNSLISQFGRYAEALRPRALMMENVPGLANDPRLARLERRLRRAGYEITAGVLDAANYGVPQRRKRFVLIGMLGRTVEFAEHTTSMATVRDAIGDLAQPESSSDPLHGYREQRSAHVERRIAAIPRDGGSLAEAGAKHNLDCRIRMDGFRDVYGRMAWDRPAPTITGGCINPSKGRFLHPQHNRAITLREAALLQAFPRNYKFALDEGRYRAAELIGNALPPVFVAHHARALRRALRA